MVYWSTIHFVHVHFESFWYTSAIGKVLLMMRRWRAWWAWENGCRLLGGSSTAFFRWQACAGLCCFIVKPVTACCQSFLMFSLQYDHAWIEKLSNRLLTSVTSNLSHVVRNGDPVHTYPGCLNLSFAYVEGASLIIWYAMSLRTNRFRKVWEPLRTISVTSAIQMPPLPNWWFLRSVGDEKTWMLPIS